MQARQKLIIYCDVFIATLKLRCCWNLLTFTCYLCNFVIF